MVMYTPRETLTQILMNTPRAVRWSLVQRHTGRSLVEEMDDLRRVHRLTVERELTMIELKKEVNALLKKYGQEEKYRIVK